MGRNLYPDDPRSLEQLSAHFYRYEFVCNCGKCKTGLDQDDFDLRVPTVLELIRAEVSAKNGYDTPLYINRGCSCWDHHEGIYERLDLPPTTQSFHLILERGQLKIVEPACAVDIRLPKGITYDQFYEICDRIIGKKGGVGKYKSRTVVHIDLRGFYKRWSM